MEEAAYDSLAMRVFAGIDRAVDAVPDATTILEKPISRPSPPRQQPQITRLSVFPRYLFPEASAHSAAIRFRIELASPPTRRVRNRPMTAPASFEGK